MAPLIGALLEQRATEGVIGRSRELALLSSLMDRQDETLLVHLHGVAEAGKTAVLDSFLASERARSVVVVHLDCRAIEPTERGFLHEVSVAIGISGSDVTAVADSLGRVASGCSSPSTTTRFSACWTPGSAPSSRRL